MTDRPSLHRGAHAYRLRLAAPRQLSRARRTARPRERQEDEGGAGLAARARLLRSRRRARVLSRARREGCASSRRSGSETYDAWKRANPDLGRAARARAARRASRGPSLAGVQRRERQRRDARCGRHGHERDRAEPSRTRRRLGRSRSVDQDLPEELRRFRARKLRRAQHPLRRARARDGCLQQRHRAARRPAAVCRDLLQLPRLPQAGAAVGVLNPASTSIYVFTHDSVFLGEDGPTHQPIEQLATLRATPNCYVVRPADRSKRSRRGSSRSAGKDAPWVLVLTRQKAAVPGRARRRRRRGALTCFPRPTAARPI